MITFSPTLNTTRILDIRANNRIGTKLPPPFTLIGIDAEAIIKLSSPSFSGSGLLKDRNVNYYTGESNVIDYQLLPKSYGGTPVEFEWVSITPNLASVDERGYVTHISNGTAIIQFSAHEQSVTRSLQMTTGGGGLQSTFIDYVTGSLSEHISTVIDSRLIGKSPDTSLEVFNVQNHVDQIYVRNSNLWCSDFTNVLTCISPWNSTGGPRMAGTLISPRHIIFAAHYQIAKNATIRFVKIDGTVVNKIMVSSMVHPSYTPYYPDLVVGLLDSDVPDGISFAKILPNNYLSYLPTTFTYSDGKLPSITLDQEEKALVTDLYNDTLSVSFTVPKDVNRLKFYEQKIGGDSGNPAFLVINGEPVILTVWTYGGAGSGTSIREQKSEINNMMTSLGGGYQLTEIDLSSFPTYL